MLKKLFPQIIATLFLAGFIAYAWTEPTVAPPGGNTESPVNVGASAQSKSGRLSVPELYDANDPAYYLNLNNISRMLGLNVAGDTRLEGDIKIKKNGVECSVYADCDNDGKTYFSGDCDESCSTCFTGSIATTPSSDGKDQNCNGRVDESISTLVKSKTCSGSPWYVNNGSCSAWCGSNPPYIGGLTPVPSEHFDGFGDQYSSGDGTATITNWDTCAKSYPGYSSPFADGPNFKCDCYFVAIQ